MAAEIIGEICYIIVCFSYAHCLYIYCLFQIWWLSSSHEFYFKILIQSNMLKKYHCLFHLIINHCMGYTSAGLGYNECISSSQFLASPAPVIFLALVMLVYSQIFWKSCFDLFYSYFYQFIHSFIHLITRFCPLLSSFSLRGPSCWNLLFMLHFIALMDKVGFILKFL